MSSVTAEEATPLRDLDIYCPQCLYNVRGVAGERCPECGLHIDREDWAASPIPWEHRAKIGRVRAYCRTVRLVTSRVARLAVATPHGLSVRDAWKFWALTVIPPAVLLALWVVADGHPTTFTDPIVTMLERYSKEPLLWMDLVGPWEAGVLLDGVVSAAVLVMVLGISLGMARVCRWSASEADRDRVWATALYSCAPLAYWTITLLCGWAVVDVMSMPLVVVPGVRPIVRLWGTLLVVVPLVWCIWRMAWTAHVVGKCSFLRAGAITVGWLLVMLFGLGVVMPWVIGLVRLMWVG